MRTKDAVHQFFTKVPHAEQLANNFKSTRVLCTGCKGTFVHNATQMRKHVQRCIELPDTARSTLGLKPLSVSGGVAKAGKGSSGKGAAGSSKKGKKGASAVAKAAAAPVKKKMKITTPRGEIAAGAKVHGVDLGKCLHAALEAAAGAAAMIDAAWEGKRTVTNKGAVDLVTETDKNCEAFILEKLRKEFPEHVFIGEEEVSKKGKIPKLTDKPTWMIDPLDGTTNFVHSFPFTCVCIGLVVRGEPVLGVVNCPRMKETYHAVKGGGAFLNGRKIAVSDTTDLKKALVATEIGTSRDSATMKKVSKRMQQVIEATRSLRCTGSCAMNMVGVACGRLDAFYEDGFGGPWDCAAGACIVTESGGVVADVDGKAFDVTACRVLCTNGKLKTAMAKALSA